MAEPDLNVTDTWCFTCSTPSDKLLTRARAIMNFLHRSDDCFSLILHFYPGVNVMQTLLSGIGCLVECMQYKMMLSTQPISNESNSNADQAVMMTTMAQTAE